MTQHYSMKFSLTLKSSDTGCFTAVRFLWLIDQRLLIEVMPTASRSV